MSVAAAPSLPDLLRDHALELLHHRVGEIGAPLVLFCVISGALSPISRCRLLSESKGWLEQVSVLSIQVRPVQR
jgi:hypothetical protein